MSARRSIPGRGAGRAAAGPGGPAGNAGARGALLLAVAVILGIVLLQQFDSDLDTGGAVAANSIPGGDQTTTTRSAGLTSVPQVTTTTARPRAKADVKVLVANGAGVRGLGAAATTALKGFGYTTLPPTDTNAGNVDRTSIQFAEGYEAEAREVAATLTQPATVVTRLASPPVAAADIGDAKVIVILGVDVANSATATTVAGVTTTTRRP